MPDSLAKHRVELALRNYPPPGKDDELSMKRPRSGVSLRGLLLLAEVSKEAGYSQGADNAAQTV